MNANPPRGLGDTRGGILEKGLMTTEANMTKT